MIASVAGFFTGLSLIIAIGAQNAYVLRLGLMRHHVFAVVLFCAVSDALLIIAGVSGLGAVIQQVPLLLEVFKYAGAAYLIWFGIAAIRRAMNPKTLEAQGESFPLVKTLATMAALTWLNPHVYLDTVILLGSIGNQFVPNQWWFTLGAVTASFVWFFSLGYGAKLLSKYMSSVRFWQVLDVVIALVMFSIALTLLFSSL